MFAVLVLVSDCDYAFLGRDHFLTLPCRARGDLVDRFAPRIVAFQLWRIAFALVPKLIDLVYHSIAEARQLARDGAQYLHSATDIVV